MADFTIYELSSTPSRTDSLLWVQIPSGAPSGYTDYRIDIPTLLAAEQSRLTVNEAAITSLGARTTILENGLTKVTYTARNAAFQYTQPANSKLSGIYMRRNGVVVPRTAVGYTLYDGGGTNGEEILSSRLHDIDTNYYREIESIPNSYNQTGTRTIYFTPITGIIDVVIYLKTNLFT